MLKNLHVVVDALYLFPVKACAGVRVSELHLSEQGLIVGDREWVVVDTAYEVVWQGSHPQLALVQPMILPNALGLSARGQQDITIPYLVMEQPCRVRFWNDVSKTHDSYAGMDAGDRAADFLQQVTGAELRLVRLSSEALARDLVQPIHITSRASLHELNRALVEDGCEAVEMMRFRPNIVISSGQTHLAPFMEEQCTQVQWTTPTGEGRLSIVEPCIRCVVVNVDPISVEVSGFTLKKVAELSSSRFSKKSVFFGSYAQVYHKVAEGQVLSEGAILELSFKESGDLG